MNNYREEWETIRKKESEVETNLNNYKLAQAIIGQV
jgi:hypothetical protein